MINRVGTKKGEDLKKVLFNKKNSLLQEEVSIGYVL